MGERSPSKSSSHKSLKQQSQSQNTISNLSKAQFRSRSLVQGTLVRRTVVYINSYLFIYNCIFFLGRGAITCCTMVHILHQGFQFYILYNLAAHFVALQKSPNQTLRISKFLSFFFRNFFKIFRNSK